MSKMPIHLEEDYTYFSELWEYKSKQNYHTNEKWNRRAEDWKIELRDNQAFQESNQERVAATIDFLKQKKLLNKSDSVIDIGCGPGRFVIEFAKHVKEVYACDISERMLDLTREYASEENIQNIVYDSCDFMTLDVDEKKWNNKFDLVFTSITPAIGTIQGIEKINQMSREYVFNSCSIHRSDSIEKKLANGVFQIEQLKKRSHSHWYYALYNLLWLQGFFPLTHFFKQNRVEKLDYGEMLIHYYMRLFKSYDIPNKKDKIEAFLKKECDSNFQVTRDIEHHYGWLLWNVNEQTQRV